MVQESTRLVPAPHEQYGHCNFFFKAVLEFNIMGMAAGTGKEPCKVALLVEM